MTESPSQFVTRTDYPEQIASDDSLEWSVYEEESAGELGFRGEFPWDLWDDPEGIAEALGLRVLRIGAAWSVSASAIAVDFAVGVYYSYSNWSLETGRTVVLRAADRELIEKWLDENWELDDVIDDENSFYDQLYDGFDFRPHVEGEPVMSLFDGYELEDYVQIVHTSGGQFALNANDPRGPRVRFVETLAQVYELVRDQLSGNLDATDPAPPWMEEWQRLDG